VTVQAREMRGRGLADGRLRVDGWLRVDGRLRGGGEMRGGGLADARLRGEVRRRNSRAPSSGTPAAGYASGLRLTRRGRVVLTGFAIVLAAALVTLFWLSAAEGAQAASHGQRPVAARRGLSRVVVRPGQTLWSIARRAEPSADPRIVVQQIIEVNALSGAMIQPGELLWVPKG
jgi:nucleoid-associated protein YgaU